MSCGPGFVNDYSTHVCRGKIMNMVVASINDDDDNGQLIIIILIIIVVIIINMQQLR